MLELLVEFLLQFVLEIFGPELCKTVLQAIAHFTGRLAAYLSNGVRRILGFGGNDFAPTMDGFTTLGAVIWLSVGLVCLGSWMFRGRVAEFFKAHPVRVRVMGREVYNSAKRVSSIFTP